MGFARNLSFTVATQLASQVLATLTGFLLVYCMAPEVKGAYDWLLQAPPLLMSLGNLGFATAITYLGGSQRFSLERLGGVGLALGTSVGVLVVALALPWLIPMGLRLDASLPLLCLALATVPALLVRSYVNTTLLVARRVARFNLVELAIPAGFLSLFLAGWFAFGLDRAQGERIVVLGVTARTLAVACSLLLALHGASALYRLRPRFDREVLRESWGTARWAYGCSAVGEMNARFGFVVLIPWLVALTATDDAAVRREIALFGMAITFADLVRSLSLAVEPILFAEVAGDQERARALTPAVARFLCALGGLASIGIAATAPLVIWIVRAEYLPALPALWILLPGTMALAVAKTIYADLMGRGMVRWIFWNTAASFLVMSVAHILFVPWLGTKGMAIGMSAGYLLQSGCAIARYRRLTGVALRDLLLPSRADLERVLSRFRRPPRNGGPA
ncbi:MAG: polysaccharide biosynthesis C-terminal domain-containing protein [Planctomycetes bacterium]|nr:polysaccharide biosynthesis C-terminal domain-containing protein [Planctomycetota bacterium]